MSDASDGKTVKAKSFGRLTHIANLARAGWVQFLTPLVQSSDIAPNQLFVGDGHYILRVGDDDQVLENKSQLLPKLKQLRSKTLDIIFTGRGSLDLTFDLPGGPLNDIRSMIETELQFRSPFGEENALWFWTAYETDTSDWNVDASIALKSAVDWVLEDVFAARMHVGVVMRQQGDGSISIIARPDWVKPAPLIGGSLARAIRSVPGPLLAPALTLTAFVASALLLFVSQTIEGSTAAQRASVARAEISAKAGVAAAERDVRQIRATSDQNVLLIGVLAAILPDNTWLEQVVIEDDTLSVTGYSPSAAEVTRLLSQIEVLSDIRYGSPVTRDNTQNTERFRIVATIEKPTL